MSGVFNTTDIERDLLSSLIRNGMMMRLHSHRVKHAFFTSRERKFIFQEMSDIFAKSKALLTETTFEYAVNAKIDDKERGFYIAEWNIIINMGGMNSPDGLIPKLVEATAGRSAAESLEQIAELMEKGQITDALAAFKKSAMHISSADEEIPTREVVETDHHQKLIADKKAHPEKYLGIKTGFYSFDKRVGGLFKAELTLVAGITGLGKSTMMKQLAINIIKHNPGKNVLHIANEESQEQVEMKYHSNITGIPYLDFKLATITDTGINEWLVKMDGMKNGRMGRLFIKEVPMFSDVTLVEGAFRELEARGIHIDVIIIDHLPCVKPIQQAWDDNDERAKAAADCKEIARSLKVAVVTPTQAATEVDKKQTKGQRASKMDVFGSKQQVHVANTFMILTLKGYDDSDPNIPQEDRNVFWNCDVKKNRDGALFLFNCKHEVKCGRVTEIFFSQNKPGVAQAVADAEEELKTMADGTTPPVVQAPVETPSEIIPEVKEPPKPIQQGKVLDAADAIDKEMEELAKEAAKKPVIPRRAAKA